MNIYYVTNKKPLSHNKRGSSETYKEAFRDEFRKKYARLYTGIPIKKKTLKSNIVYIHQLLPGHIPDVDNLSKPIVDAFCGLIYDDDKQVIKRSATIVELKDFDFVTVDATYMPIEIFNAFHDYYVENEQHIIYYEVGEFSTSQIKIGEL